MTALTSPEWYCRDVRCTPNRILWHSLKDIVLLRTGLLIVFFGLIVVSGIVKASFDLELRTMDCSGGAEESKSLVYTLCDRSAEVFRVCYGLQWPILVSRLAQNVAGIVKSGSKIY